MSSIDLGRLEDGEAEAQVPSQEERPRRCDDARQAWQEVKEGLDREATLRSQLAIVKTDAEGVWRWQGDGYDHPESLSCPVVMSAKTLRGFLAREQDLAAAVERLTRERDGAIAGQRLALQQARDAHERADAAEDRKRDLREEVDRLAMDAEEARNVMTGALRARDAMRAAVEDARAALDKSAGEAMLRARVGAALSRVAPSETTEEQEARHRAVNRRLQREAIEADARALEENGEVIHAALVRTEAGLPWPGSEAPVLETPEVMAERMWPGSMWYDSAILRQDVARQTIRARDEQVYRLLIAEADAVAARTGWLHEYVALRAFAARLGKEPPR